MANRPIFITTILFFAFGASSFAQLGSQHGVAVSWTASTSTVAGYNVYRSSNGTTFTKLNTALDPGTSFLDGSAAPSTTYEYDATAVDASGNESAASNVATVTTPATFPTNPTPPSGCNAKVQ